MESLTLYEGIKSVALLNPELSVFRYKEKNIWKSISYSEYVNQGEKLANSLFHHGIKKGDVVASYSNNCVELNILDLALLKIGAIHAMFFPNYSVNNLINLIEYVKPKVIFGNSGLFLSNLMKVKNTSSHSFKLYSLSPNKKSILSATDLIFSKKSQDVHFEKVYPTDPYSIYFTSGTTGNIKGALVSNQAIINTITTLQKLFPVRKNETSISIAPLSVSSERCLNYFYQCSAITTYYPERMDQIVPNIQEAKPSIFLTSPLMLHKIRDTIYTKLDQLPNGFKKNMLQKALRYAENEKNIQRKSLSKFIYNKIVYTKFRNILGGRVRFIVSGGAASSKSTLVFCHNIGIPVFEGYGMTECHTIAVNKPQAIKNTYNNVGTAFGETEIKISEEGEILCRSPYMFYEYYNQANITRQSFTDDGFFKTGDRGVFDENGNLKISGRIKSIFKTMAGIYINPEGIESLLMQSPLFEQVLVLGEHKKYLTALIYPNESIRNGDPDKARLRITADIEKYNNTKAETEQIRDFYILNEPFTVEKGELTTSQKPIRRVIEQHFQKEIDEMYNNK